MMHIRGHADITTTGPTTIIPWAYKDVLPYFKKMENRRIRPAI
jgi:hypothetical protein